MEIFIVIIILVFSLIGLGILYGFNVKEIKRFADNEELDKTIAKMPTNSVVCKELLEKLNNRNVKIEEKQDSDTSLYIAMSNKIIIANTRNSYTRIQTIAHECLHSIQDRKLLIFNYIYSNIYLIIFILSIVLGITKILPNKLVVLTIFMELGIIYYFVRSYLEDDAMTKARFLAKEYMDEKNILTQEEIDDVIDEYDKLNNKMIKATNFSLFMNVIIKTILLGIVLLIF